MSPRIISTSLVIFAIMSFVSSHVVCVSSRRLSSRTTISRQAFGHSLSVKRSDASQLHPLSTLVSFSHSPSHSELELLKEQIDQLAGSTLNVKSPKQVSTAIFGSPQTATKSVLLKAANKSTSTLSPEKQRLAQLVLEYKGLLQQQQRRGSRSTCY